LPLRYSKARRDDKGADEIGGDERPAPSFYRLGFVDQHDRDIVADWVEEFAGRANEPVAGVIELKLTLAFGARQNVEQVLAYRHRG
jgi:hypothetical protein